MECIAELTKNICSANENNKGIIIRGTEPNDLFGNLGLTCIYRR